MPDREAYPEKRVVVVVTTLQSWIAEEIESKAGWRRSVAERYPEDLRNENSSNALWDLAVLVRGLADDDPAFEKVGTLSDAALTFDAGITLPDEIGRFGFEQRRPAVGYADAIWALDAIYDASLRFWRDVGDELPLALTELLERELGPEDDVDDEDATEAVHARIDRLEARVTRLERSP